MLLIVLVEHNHILHKLDGNQLSWNNYSHYQNSIL